MQGLYTYYVCKKANYDGALEQIKGDFIPDVFADPLVDKAQLAQEGEQALALFNDSLVSLPKTLAGTVFPSDRVRTAVGKAKARYESELTKDAHRLEQGLNKAVVSMNQACVRIWQLLVEWVHIAKKQAERPRLSQPTAKNPSGFLFQSPLLQRLQVDDALAKLVNQTAASWEAHMSLVERWYNQFVKQDPRLQQLLAQPITPTQEQQLLTLLIEDIIFGQDTIQNFFIDADLNWMLHKRIVKKLVRRGLLPSDKNSAKSSNLTVLDLASEWDSEQHFYTVLIQKTLQEDEVLETLIAQKSENWTVDRIMLLDKTIIKLALCEMLYFSSIPIKVSINEYIDIAKIYNTSKSNQFINGLLDAVAATLHQEEEDAKKT